MLFFKQELKWYNRIPSYIGCIGLPKSFGKANALIEEYIPVWKELKTYTDGRICFHVYKLYYSLLRDPEYYEFSKYDRNALLWVTLLHDICKLGPPAVPGKDPLHPFKSACQTLHCFNTSFKFTDLSAEDMQEWDKIFEEGYIMSKAVNRQNHAIVPKVKRFLDEKLKGKDFEKEIIIYVLLHQSIPTLKDHPHASLLTPLETEVPKYFTKRTFKVFGMFLLHDSFSYLLYNPKQRTIFGKEIEENMQALVDFMKENIEEAKGAEQAEATGQVDANNKSL